MAMCGSGYGNRHTDRTVECSQTQAYPYGGHGAARSHPPDPAFRSFSAYGPIIAIEGLEFGKEFLRMAGIVQMLHLRKGSNDT